MGQGAQETTDHKGPTFLRSSSLQRGAHLTRSETQHLWPRRGPPGAHLSPPSQTPSGTTRPPPSCQVTDLASKSTSLLSGATKEGSSHFPCVAPTRGLSVPGWGGDPGNPKQTASLRPQLLPGERRETRTGEDRDRQQGWGCDSFIFLGDRGTEIFHLRVPTLAGSKNRTGALGSPQNCPGEGQVEPSTVSNYNGAELDGTYEQTASLFSANRRGAAVERAPPCVARAELCTHPHRHVPVEPRRAAHSCTTVSLSQPSSSDGLRLHTGQVGGQCQARKKRSFLCR